MLPLSAKKARIRIAYDYYFADKVLYYCSGVACMRYFPAGEAVEKWGVSERSARNYCASGRVAGAFLTGKTWNIPETASKPARKNARAAAPGTLLEILRDEKKRKLSGGIYHRVQIDLTYTPTTWRAAA